MSTSILPLIVFLFPLAYSPGPGNMFFAANGARFGLRATLGASAGYHLATWVVTVAVGSGFLAALDRFPALFAGLKIAGGLYVLWIAWRLFQSGAMDKDSAARPAGLVDGAVLFLLNPKAYVIIALMFTQFLGAGDAGKLGVVVLISTVFTLNNLIAFTIWTWAGDALSRRFRSQGGARRLNAAFSTILAGVALWMLLS